MTAIKKARIARPASSPIRLEDGEILHVGVDAHKVTYYVAVLSDRRGLLATWAQPADLGLFIDKLKPFVDQVAQVVSEAGPAGFALTRRHRAAGLEAEVIAPSKTPTLPGLEDKCDRIDCRKLAAFAQKGLLSPVRVPTDREEGDRQVVRLREQLVRKLSSIQQQIKAFLVQHGIAEPEGLGHWSRQAVASLRGLDLDAELRFCLDVLLDERGHALAQVARVGRRLDELMRAERHREAVGVLRSVPGVGPVTAMTFRTELPAPERFRDGGQVVRMVGLTPMSIRAAGLASSRRPGGGSPGTRRRRRSTAGWSRRPAAARRRSWGWPADWRSSCGG